ncbi:MAG: aminopeptidase N, partial [Rhodococcus sp.]|nr:aminopeptidase N [Rhodococcus sp. (in: high G+C Gram-positive bacteria)]
MNTANLTREETSRRAADIAVRSYRVEVDLRGAPNSERASFPTRTTVEFSSLSDTTWLDFIGESVESVTVNGTQIPVHYDGARIRLSGLAGENTVTVDAHARYSRSGEGLHRFTDPVDDATYLYTQYEPADARRVFACFEQPDLKGRFTFVVWAPQSWEVLSNQQIALRSGECVTFEQTLPISTYITAIVAGPYHRVDAVWRGPREDGPSEGGDGEDGDGEGGGGEDEGELEVPLGVLCRASLASSLDADDIVRVTRQCMDFYSRAFEYPYPFGKYDQVFVPEYNLGAMENPGCVTFTEAYVFRGTATADQRQRRANTIAHEMAHMWFGDLVTMVWWDDLWLKESFADYMGSLVCAEATEFSDAWVAFANRRKAWAYVQDQLPTTHPVVATIDDLEAAKLNFDGITYAKGASVLKQLVAYVGRDAFFRGAQQYFRDHAFGNTTLDDLLTALSESSGRDLREWSRAWLETTGMSTVSWDGDAIVQTDPRPHRIAIGRYEEAPDGTIERVSRIDVDIDGERTAVDVAPAALVLPNDDDLTYAKVRLDEHSLATVE